MGPGIEEPIRVKKGAERSSWGGAEKSGREKGFFFYVWVHQNLAACSDGKDT